jgi:hypothetical protein
MSGHQYDTGLVVYYATYIARYVGEEFTIPRRQAVKDVRVVSGFVDQETNTLVNNSEIPSNLVLRKISPKIWLPALTIIREIVTM